MQQIRLFFLALFSLTAVSLSPALAEIKTNGPVPTTVGPSNYSVYYTTPMDFLTIVQLMGTPTASGKYSVGPIDGLGTNTLFMIPWWNPSSSAAALSAAQTWYNTVGWPINNGVRLPNGAGTETPYFAYSTDDGATFANYVALKYDVENPNTPIVITSSVSTFDQFSFALAGVSN